MPSPLPTASAVSRTELLACGHSASAVGRQLRAGRLLRVSPGIYRTPDADDNAHARILAVARRSPGLVVALHSAVLLWTLPLIGHHPGRVQLIRAGSSGADRSPHRVVHAARLDPDEITMRAGVQVTTPERTLVDLARWGRPITALAAADAALHGGIVSPDGLRSALQRAAGARAVRRARALLAWADGRSESPGESLTRFQIVDGGLPAPELQIEVRDADGVFLGRCDLGYLESATLIEFDGAVKYQALLQPGETASAAVIREKRREDALRAAGVTVLRVTWDEAWNQHELIRRIERACRIGARAVAAGAVTAALTPASPIRLP